MSDYPEGRGSNAGAGAAVVVAVLLIGLLVLGGLGLAGYFYVRVQQKTIMAREAAMRAEAIAQRQAAEAARAQAEAELQRAEAQREEETQARRMAEEANSAFERALQETEKAHREAEELRQQLLELKSRSAAETPASPASSTNEGKELLAYLNAEGSVYVDQEPKDWDEIAAILDELKESAGARVVIVAEKDCRMEPVLRMMQLAKQRELNVTVSTREFDGS